MVIEKIKESGVVAVIRGTSSSDAIKISNACIEGGIKLIEITYTTPNASEVISVLNKSVSNDVLLGAGTVLDKNTAKAAIDAGSKFIVSPGFDYETAVYCKEVGIPYVPGCQTITEIMNATKHGSKLIKLFPGSAYGPGYIKAIKGPLPNIDIMPTGGVDINNLEEWIKNGCVAVGVGGKLTAPAKTGEYDKITDLARQFVKRFNEVKGGE